MNLIEYLHEKYIFGHRVRALTRGIEKLLPHQCQLLDVGCGDGLIASRIAKSRPDLSIEGIDVLVREKTFIPVTAFDGETMPFGDNSFDVLMFVDVLHHTQNPEALLCEARRVSRGIIIIKDHNCDGYLANATLRFMDRVGNQRFGVDLPYSYLSKKSWNILFREYDFEIDSYTQRIGLYPALLKPFFERSLHFLVRLKTHKKVNRLSKYAEKI
ncbi:MAG: methyltransferase domain-containing protein [Cyanobacteria bacterium P01_D01_bin.44]